MNVNSNKRDPWHALAHKNRRRLLTYLLTEYVVDAKDNLNIQADLYHNHLPKLEELGYIEWNRETGVIERGPNWDEIEPFMKMIDKHQDELPDDWL